MEELLPSVKTKRKILWTYQRSKKFVVKVWRIWRHYKFKDLFCYFSTKITLLQPLFIPSTFSSQNIFQSNVLVDCWQYLCSYKLLKQFVNPYKGESLVLILNFFQVETDFYCEKHLHTDLITWPRLSQAKSESNSLPDHLFFYRLWHIKSFIRPSLDIIYGFCLDTRESRCTSIIQLYFIQFV